MKEEELRAIEAAATRMDGALPHLQIAATMARMEGVVQLGVISVKPDGGGRISARFEAEEFLLDLATVNEAAARVPAMGERLLLAAADDVETRIDCGARQDEPTGDAVRRALAERDATIERIRTYVQNFCSHPWDHGDECPHFCCVSPDNCADGEPGDEDCESPGETCDCYVADIDALLAEVTK